jgi:hypothetical protein
LERHFDGIFGVFVERIRTMEIYGSVWEGNIGVLDEEHTNESDECIYCTRNMIPRDNMVACIENVMLVT